MDLTVYALCVSLSEALMVLFVYINFPYYKMSYGKDARRIMARAIILNTIALLIGWGPAVYFFPEFSQKYLLSAACILGALGCVGSRFIYQEIIPDQLAEKIIEYIEKKQKH